MLYQQWTSTMIHLANKAVCLLVWGGCQNGKWCILKTMSHGRNDCHSSEHMGPNTVTIHLLRQSKTDPFMDIPSLFKPHQQRYTQYKCQTVYSSNETRMLYQGGHFNCLHRVKYVVREFVATSCNLTVMNIIIVKAIVLESVPLLL